MMERANCLLRDEAGATAIEIAVVLPAFFLMLFGLFGFALVLFGYANATFACRQGARFASLGSITSVSPATSATVQAVVNPLLFVDAGAVVSTTTTYAPSNTVGSTVKVRVTITYPMSIPFMSAQPITVSSAEQRTILR